MILIFNLFVLAASGNEPGEVDANLPPAAPPKVVWSATCEIRKQKIQLDFKASADVDQYKDLTTHLLTPNGEVEISEINGNLVPTPMTQKKLSVCNNTMGVVVQKTKLLLLLAQEKSKTLHRMNALVINSIDSKILGVSTDIGDYVVAGRNKLFLKKIPDGLGALIPQGWKKNQKEPSPENFQMGWLQLTFSGEKIVKKWEMPLPPSVRPYLIDAAQE